MGAPSKGTALFWWSAFAAFAAIIVWSLLPGAIVLVTGAPAPSWMRASSLPVLLLGGMTVGCFLWIAETIRRGEIRRSAAPRGKVLPSATRVSRVEMLSLPVHAAWFAGMFVVGTGLLIRAFPEVGDDAFTAWLTVGAALVLCAGVALGSFVKKVAWARHLTSRRAPVKPSPFWRWVTYRWRLELWACAVGFGALFAGVAIVAAMQGSDFGTAEDYAEARPIAIGLLVGGAVALAAGLWAATQFWRSGEDLETGESFS